MAYKLLNVTDSITGAKTEADVILRTSDNASIPKDEIQVCGYLGIKPVFDLGNVSKNKNKDKISSAQMSIVKYANKELISLESDVSSD